MITITEQPPSIASFAVPMEPPVALSDCLRWCLLADSADVFSTPGSKATLVITIPATCTVPANGTAFKVWGRSFTVQSGTDFEANSFKVNAIGLLTWINLANMFAANLFFNRAVKITGQVVGLNYELTLTWNDCREQASFTGANMDLVVFTTIGGSATATNGVSPILVDAYRIITRAIKWIDATSGYTPLSSFVGLEVEKLCDEAGEVCLTYNQDIASQLYTLLPALTSSSFVEAIDNGRTMMSYYSIEYGWTYRIDCLSQSGTIKKADRVLVLNAAFDIDDPYQMRRFWYGHPDGYPPDQIVSDYLTSAPKRIKLCNQSFKWLWLLNSWQDDQPQYSLLARFVIYDLSGGISSIETAIVNDALTDASSSYQPVNFNVSPSRLVDEFALDLADISQYDVQVVGVNPLDSGDIYFNASEYITIELAGNCCEEFTDLYFLNSSGGGGIDTIVLTVKETEVVQEGLEIDINIPCDTPRVDAATTGGRSLVPTRTYTKYKLVGNFPRTPEYTKWLKHLRQSPQRWVKIIDEGGIPLAKKFIMDPGGLITYEVAKGIEVEISGYLQDIPTLPGTEKNLLA